MTYRGGSLVSFVVVLFFGGIAVAEAPDAERQLRRIGEDARVPAQANRAESEMREITALVNGEERRLLLPTDPGPGLKVEMIPLGQPSGQVAAEPAAPILYDTTPSTTGNGWIVDTNGSIPYSDESVGDVYWSDSYNRNPFELEGFMFYGGAIAEGGTHGRVFFWFYDSYLRFVGKYFYSDLPSGVIQFWYWAGYPDWVIPSDGVVIMTTGDGSNGPNCYAAWYQANGATVGYANPTSMVIDGSRVNDPDVDPDILSLKLEGNWQRMPLEAIGGDCCGRDACSDASCRTAVSAHDSWCATSWDWICGGYAQQLCPGLCETKNRYLSFRVPRALSGTLRVIQVTPIFMYQTALGCVGRPGHWPDLTALEGRPVWAGISYSLPEDSAGGTFLGGHAWDFPMGAGDDWAYWTDGGVVHVFGPAILPCSVYEIRISDDVFMNHCDADFSTCAYSDGLAVATGNFGDVDPSNSLSVLDSAEVVDKLKLQPGRMSKVFTQLYPSLLAPYDNVSVLDVAMVVDGLKSRPYPYHGVP